MQADQVVDTLEARDNVLQCAIACVAIGIAAVEFLNRPIGGIVITIDGNNDNLHGHFAIRKGLQIYDEQPFDLFSGYRKFVHV